MTLQGEWKNVELRVPDDRRMYAAFRGALPSRRSARTRGLDEFLLRLALAEGAELLAGEVQEFRRRADGRIDVCYRVGGETRAKAHWLLADFVALATGVNHTPGLPFREQRFLRAILPLLPRFRPPKIRRTLVAEVRIASRSLRPLLGEAFFGGYGSGRIRIEMSSMIPKREFLTVVLIGPTVDRAQRGDGQAIIAEFFRLPHVQRILPLRFEAPVACLCGPGIPVTAARGYVADRVAAVGDLAVARLYKDGLYSAFLTARALADTVLQLGVDARSLREGYMPVVEKLRRDNRYGRLVFLLNRIAFGNRGLSRILYQAILTERKNKPEHQRRLAQILWKIASGDDSYRRVFFSMFHPKAIYRIVVGGLLVTLRNVATEAVFGLKWEGFGRYPTGLHREDFVAKKTDILPILEAFGLGHTPDVERMYSIRVRSTPARILRELGRFGDPDRQFFRPRFVDVRRVAGEPNRVGCRVRYKLPFPRLSFQVELVSVEPGRRLVYRVLDGFARGGLLLFELDRCQPKCHLLSIYVGFNFPRGRNVIQRLLWRVFAIFFPGFAHDVVWNHSLCQLKHLIESQ